VNTYMFDGQMAYQHSGNAPVYATNSGGRTWSDETGAVDDGWEADGEMVRSAYTLHAEDDDFGQPGTLVREVMNDAQRQRLVDQVAGALLGGVHGEVLKRAFQYWKNIDADIGKRIEQKVRAGAAPEPAQGMGQGSPQGVAAE
jgi:catalase